MKIVTILESRPQFIKTSTICREITRQKIKGKNIEEIIVHTRQHFDEIQIPKPNYFLSIGEKSYGDITEQMIEKMVNSYKDTIVFKSKDIYLYSSGIVSSNYKRIAKV